MEISGEVTSEVLPGFEAMSPMLKRSGAKNIESRP